MTYYNRRRFLTHSAAGFAATAAALGGLTARSAHAANISGYKAMVCIMLKGGMDHNDVILPTDQPSYDALRALRPGLFDDYNYADPASSRNREAVLSLNASNIAGFGGRTFGLPPNMAPLQALFESGEAAIVGNVGPLIEPVTRTDLNNGNKDIPARLFSHNDQQSTWMALNTEGAQLGWGGRFADAMIAADQVSNPLYAAMTSSSPDVFLAGNGVQQFRIPSGSQAISPEATRVRRYLGSNSDGDAARALLAAYLEKQSFGHDNIFQRDVIKTLARGVTNQADYNNALAMPNTVTAAFPSSSIGGQLGSIARAISLRGTLNVKRQVFYSVMGGLDTHNNQAGTLPVIQTQLADGIAAFRQAMIDEGVWNDVVVFTMSDFGRTLIGNGDGTDHGWGAHHFVVGGSVAGGKIYGDIPPPDLSSQHYTEQRGRLIPTTPVEKYAQALGSWFGLDSGELASVLPNLSRFDNTALDLFGGVVN